MFIDQKPPIIPLAPQAVSVPARTLLSRKEFIIIAVVAAALVLGAGGWWYWKNILNAPKAQEPTPIVNPQTPGLPGTLGSGENVNQNTTEENPDLKGENVTFGAFYKPLNESLDLKIAPVGLPLNIKSQVSNYYDTARKINLDPAIGNLNQDGFGIIDNPFSKSKSDFLGTYYELNQRSIPIVITGDFLLYYYQNSLKQIYKEIESSFFYESIWKITNQLYEQANGRYQERRQKLGVSSDALLESERLEAAYFAAGLMLLRPEEGQVNATEDLNDSRRFKPSEVSRFSFTPPGYLTDDVTREIALIREAKVTVKSPVLLYDRDYREFKIPDEYQTSAKLRNFYLASRWYTSLFPLYFRDKDCPSCLLDREDWIINQSAAHLIASDLSASQSLKNEWAKIYKVISYFSGLRSELTYLHYDAVRQEAFAKASLEEILGSGSYDRLITLRDKIAKLEFKATEGAYSRISASERPILGMRLLQTFYWPSRSFYNQLTFDPVGNHLKPMNGRERASYLTSCQDRDKLYRCRGLGYDILRPVLERIPKSKFLADNTNYERYTTQLESVKKQLDSFDAVSWHNNNFWTTLSIVSALTNEKMTSLPYDGSDRWVERKTSSALATLANLTLPADTWQVARDRQAGGLEVSGTLAALNYIEPNSKLADELVANTKMLFDTLARLEVVRDNDVNFSGLLSKMTTSRMIIRKELQGTALTNDDYQFMGDFVSQFRLQSLGGKTATIEFYDAKAKRSQLLKQSISDVKLLLLVYEKDGKKLLAVGPIFSYKEQ